ncbi:M56 family metallopeptidase [Dyadobacter arcticus]|nr:M56 family metallopeptidase [Dyadobacter arcticus]
MNFDVITQPYFQKLVQAICLTLLHSLWQGLIAAGLAGAVLILTGKSKPAFRYNLLSLVLIAFVLGVGFTFSVEMGQKNGISEAAQIQNLHYFPANAAQTRAVDNLNAFSKNFKWIDSLMFFCGQNAGFIVAIWFLIFGIKSVQAASGLVFLHRIRRQKIYEPDEKWRLRFQALAFKLNISQKISLMESENITVPMVIGFLKPIVLIPFGLLANLPASQVEAILLHELAHIRRRDYLVNLIQIFSENVFFFNPAVLWISSVLKEEREHCCDDLAISVMRNKTSFVEALVSFQEYKTSSNIFAMTFSKKRNHLLDRIKRIINNNNKPLDAMEKLFVVISLVLVAVLSAAVSHVAPNQPAWVVSHQENRQKAEEKQEIASRISLPVRSSTFESDTLPKKKKSENTIFHSANIHAAQDGISTYDVTANGKAYTIVQTNGKTTALVVNGKPVPDSEMASYQTEIDKIIKDIKVAHDDAEKQRQEADKQREEADLLRQQADVQRKGAEQNRVHANELRLEANKHRQEADKMRGDAEKMRAEADKQRQEADKHRVEANKAREHAEEFRFAAEQNRQEYEKMQNGVIDELISAGAIKGISDLSYRLSQDELIVNGVKQPAELHQKLKNKYIKDKAVEMVYNYKGRTGYTTTGLIYTK